MGVKNRKPYVCNRREHLENEYLRFIQNEYVVLGCCIYVGGKAGADFRLLIAPILEFHPHPTIVFAHQPSWTQRP